MGGLVRRLSGLATGARRTVIATARENGATETQRRDGQEQQAWSEFTQSCHDERAETHCTFKGTDRGADTKGVGSWRQPQRRLHHLLPSLRAGAPFTILTALALVVTAGPAAAAARSSVAALQTQRSGSGRSAEALGEQLSLKAPHQAPSTTLTHIEVVHHRARLQFDSSAPDARFHCKLDHRSFRACRSPVVYNRLDAGRHRVKVFAEANGSRDSTPAKERFHIPRRRAGPPFPPVKHIVPAHIADPGVCDFISPEVFWPVRNAWEAASRRRLTIVCAGAGGDGHRSTGEFAILRQNYVRSRQSIRTVSVPRSGPVSITSAPLGPNRLGAAQRRAVLGFESDSGLQGELDLSDDTVELTMGG